MAVSLLFIQRIQRRSAICLVLCFFLLSGCQLTENFNLPALSSNGTSATPPVEQSDPNAASEDGNGAVPDAGTPAPDRDGEEEGEADRTRLENGEISPPTPEPTPTETPYSSPTPDPSLPTWTILVYMAADNNLDSAALLNLNQMEAARGSEEVNIIVQVDRASFGAWSDTRRYRIRPDEDLTTLGSELLAEMGELNMGDPATLTDFVSWGIESYPAQHYGLVMWNHGVGWSGIASDDTDRDDLSLNDLRGGLDRALDPFRPARPDLRFDLIGFDACLMGQLEVYSALVPFAHYAVASEELTPIQGWSYTDWLNQLVSEAENQRQAGLTSGPEIGRQAAIAAVDTFLNYYSETTHQPFVTMAAIDLSKIESVTTALNSLMSTVATEPDLTIGRVGQARAGSETYARAYGLDADRYSAIDLHHFSALLANKIDEPAILNGSQALQETIDEAVVHNGHGLGLNQANGIAIHFPGDTGRLDPSYMTETENQAWVNFVQTYHAKAVNETGSPPEIEIQANLDGQRFNSLNPPFFSFLVSGLNIQEVSLWAGLYITDQDGTVRRQLLEYDPLIPEPSFLANGSQQFVWRDGQHDDFFIWSTRVTYLNDGTNGQFVVMWPSAPTQLEESLSGPKTRSVEGVYLSQAEGREYRANLIFEQESQTLEQVWGFTPGGEPFEIRPQAGDQFRPYSIFLDENDQLLKEPGVTLNFSEEGELFYDWRPVVDGRYFFGFFAENQAGRSTPNWVDFDIVNNGSTADLRGYLDPYLGFQFSYPAEWYRPTYRDATLFTTDQSGELSLQISIFPDLEDGITAENLKSRTLSEFGTVEILYEDDAIIFDRGALSTAYGYTAQSGEPHTGIFYTFVHENTGYLIDLDSLTSREQELLAAGRQISNSFTFRSGPNGGERLGIGLFPTAWPRVDLEAFQLPKPEDFIPEPENAGWSRLRATWDSRAFLAIRSENSSEKALTEILDEWAGVASSGVSNYTQTEPFRIGLGDRLWLRRNFSYQAEGIDMRGFIATTRIGNRAVVAWAEAPANSYAQIESNVFGVMLAELE